MTTTQLKPVSVYMTSGQFDIIEKLALRESRSVSNLLLTLALEKAEAAGILMTKKTKTVLKVEGP